MSKIYKFLLFSVLISLFLEACFIFAFSFLDSSETVNRVAIALGGDVLNGGYIQFSCYVIFFLSVFLIYDRLGLIEQEYEAYHLGLLPEDDFTVLSPEDVQQIKLKVTSVSGSFLLTKLLKVGCTKFRANRSVAEVMSVVQRQSELNFQTADSSSSIIRYLNWSIPSIGFIGTVLGIAASIGTVKGDVTPEIIDEVTSLLGLAFDTTLIALFLSLISTYLLYKLQEQEELLHTKLEQYIVENFVNRIYVAQ